MVLKIFLWAITLVICIKESFAGSGICTLDEMKLLAAEACEHLFRNDVEHLKQKREITNDIPDIEEESDITQDDRYHHHGIVRVHRKDYPITGYLFINRRHAKLLSRMDYNPEYTILPLKSHHREMIDEMEANGNMHRNKRDASNGSYVNLPYCCLNKCRTDLFCRR